MQYIKKNNLLTVFTENGMFSKSVTEEEYQDFLNNINNENYVIKLIAPDYGKYLKERQEVENLISQIKHSDYVVQKHESFYIPSISELSVPLDLVKRIIDAEINKDKVKLKSYFNFWTLCCCNPDSRVRANLFWFLNKNGLIITKSGLFVGYRNCIKTDYFKKLEEAYNKIKKTKKSPKNYHFSENLGIQKYNGIGLSLYYQFHNIFPFTDSYSGTTKIKLGHPVFIPREETDTNQDNICSFGLHIGTKSFIKNSYGDISLKVLVSPSDVVAVPPKDDYEKLRTCRYFPFEVIKDLDAPETVTDGYEDAFFSFLDYNGIKANDEHPFSFIIPNIPELDKDRIKNNIDSLRKELRNKTKNYV